MSAIPSLIVGFVFIGLAFLIRAQARHAQPENAVPKNTKLGFGMMIMAGIVWIGVAALDFIKG